MIDPDYNPMDHIDLEEEETDNGETDNEDTDIEEDECEEDDNYENEYEKKDIKRLIRRRHVQSKSRFNDAKRNDLNHAIQLKIAKGLLPLSKPGEPMKGRVLHTFKELASIHRRVYETTRTVDLDVETNSRPKGYNATDMLAFMPDYPTQTLEEFMGQNKFKTSEIYEFADSSRGEGPCHMYHGFITINVSAMIDLWFKGHKIYVKRHAFNDQTSAKNAEGALRHQRIRVICGLLRGLFEDPTDSLTIVSTNVVLLRKNAWSGEVTPDEFEIAFVAAMTNSFVTPVTNFDEWIEWQPREVADKAPRTVMKSLKHRSGTGWTADEDKLLLDAVKKYTTKWSIVCKSLPNRTCEQCRSRWRYVVNPTISRNEWKPEEDQLIRDARKDGLSTELIARLLPFRTHIQVQNRICVLSLFAFKTNNEYNKQHSIPKLRLRLRLLEAELAQVKHKLEVYSAPPNKKPKNSTKSSKSTKSLTTEQATQTDNHFIEPSIMTIIITNGQVIQ